MKFLRKINKGLVLTIIVLTVLIIYLVCQEVQRGREKENIKKACEDYIEFIDKYSVLKEQYQTVEPSISKEELKKYVEEFKTELKQYSIDNDVVLDIQAKVLKTNLEDLEMSGASVTTKFDRKIKKIKKYQFDGNSVTVTLENNVEKETKEKDILTGEEKTENSDFTANEDTITLKKENDKWKIVYANLQSTSYDEMDGGITTLSL